MAVYDLTQSIPAASALQYGDILNCPYSGSAKTVQLPAGRWKLQCWGAQGGNGYDAEVTTSTSTYYTTMMSSNYVSYFDITNSTYGFIIGSDNYWKANNTGKNSTTASTTWTCKISGSYVLEYSYVTEQNYDKVTLTTTDTSAGSTGTHLSEASGSSSGSIPLYFDAGDTIVMTYSKDSSQHASGEEVKLLIKKQETSTNYNIGTKTGYAGACGGYSEGTLSLAEQTTLYLYTGGQGGSSTSSTWNIEITGGFNGGGKGKVRYYSKRYSSAGGGGGASDIRIGQDSLYARVIVAGGGGGDSGEGSLYTKVGGGLTSGSAVAEYQATQTKAGTNGSFGVGADSTGYGNYNYGPGGGGGGWYGGGASTSVSDSNAEYRNYNGGGSGYVYSSSTASDYPSGCLLSSKYYLSNASTVNGGSSITLVDGTTGIGRTGNGYIRLTFLGSLEVTITYDWGGSLTYSQKIVPGTDKLIQNISELPSDCQTDFRAKLAANELVSGINFDKISLYRDKLGLSGNLYYPDSSTSNITSDLILYPLISFSIHCDVIYIGSLNETTHNIRGISTGIKYYLDSNKNFQLQGNSFNISIFVDQASSSLSSFTYNNKTFNTYGWDENSQWNSLYQNGQYITVNIKNGYPTSIVKNYSEVYIDSTPINLILNNNSTDKTQTIKLRDQTLLMVLEASLSTQSNPTTTLPKNPFSKKGYRFRGWSLNKDDLPGSSTVLAPGTSISLSASTTYYAIWELKPQSSLRMWYGIDGKWAPMS